VHHPGQLVDAGIVVGAEAKEAIAQLGDYLVFCETGLCICVNCFLCEVLTDFIPVADEAADLDVEVFTKYDAAYVDIGACFEGLYPYLQVFLFREQYDGYVGGYRVGLELAAT
jgi:hypothetical protein